MSGKRQVFRISVAGRVGAVVMAGLIGLFAAGFVTLTITLLFAWQFTWVLPTAGLSAFLCSLAVYVLRDLRAKLGWRVEVGDASALVSLPAGRSLYHRPRAFHGAVDYLDLSHVECRPELYAQLGTESRIDTWWLVPKTGEALFLAEDRTTDPRYDIRTTFAGEAATAIAKAAGVKVKRRQEAEGHAGILGVWGVRPPGA